MSRITQYVLGITSDDLYIGHAAVPTPLHKGGDLSKVRFQPTLADGRRLYKLFSHVSEQWLDPKRVSSNYQPVVKLTAEAALRKTLDVIRDGTGAAQRERERGYEVAQTFKYAQEKHRP